MIRLKNVQKTYISGLEKIIALDNVNLEIYPGEFTVILGPSGSGKSTMLNMLGGMDRPSSGEIEIDGEIISDFSDKQLTEYRRKKVGFIFQFYNLVANLTAYENVGIAAKLNGNVNSISQIISDVGLQHRMNNFPNQLSGGEMQRVAIARAVAKSPRLLLCDEPTGALDSTTGVKILKILKNYSQNENTSVVVVTHNASIAEIGDRVIRILDGHVMENEKNDNPKKLSEVVW